MADVDMGFVKKAENGVELLAVEVVLDQVCVAFFDGLELDESFDFMLEVKFEQWFFIELFEDFSRESRDVL